MSLGLVSCQHRQTQPTALLLVAALWRGIGRGHSRHTNGLGLSGTVDDDLSLRKVKTVYCSDGI